MNEISTSKRDHKPTMVYTLRIVYRYIKVVELGGVAIRSDIYFVCQI